MRRLWCVFVCTCAVLIGGCATVPKEAVTLSDAVGRRLADMQTSHEQAVGAYFQLTRERVETFLETRWIPEFLGSFVEESNLLNMLAGVKPLTPDQDKRIRAELDKASVAKANQDVIVTAVNSAFGNPERGQLVLQFNESAIKQIELKRKSLIDPINVLEKKAMADLRDSYSQLLQAQSVVTGHLNSVHKVTEAQDQVLNKLGLLQKRDKALQDAIDVNDQVSGIISKAKTGLAGFDDLKSHLLKSSGTPETPATP